MKNEPLSADEHLKIVAFTLLIIPSFFVIIGVIPAIILATGIYLTKKNKDFSGIEASTKAARIFYQIVMFPALLFAVIGTVNWILLSKTV